MSDHTTIDTEPTASQPEAVEVVGSGRSITWPALGRSITWNQADGTLTCSDCGAVNITQDDAVTSGVDHLALVHDDPHAAFLTT